MSKELDDKREQLHLLRIEFHEMESKERRENDYPKMRELAGTFWKYRNCYSAAKEEDHWWLYRYVKKVQPDGIAVVSEFETDKHGEIKIWADRQYPWDSLERLGISSNAEEWDEALGRVRSQISDMVAIVGDDEAPF